jgi:chromosome segregation ATPase
VFQAADALLIEGHKPTIDRVRMRIGRGSPNTIQEHLEVWWTHLGSRLRDVPGREFPELPERVALALQKLWNEALDSAHEALGEKVSTRERSLVEREEALGVREQQFLEQEQAAIARAAAQEESLALAREQLLAANQRADRLEASLTGRETECERQRVRIDALETDAAQLRQKSEAAAAAHQAERTKLDERHAATEGRWLVEIDHARQAAKEAAREQERQSKEWRAQMSQLQAEREELKKHLQEARSEARTHMTERAQLEKQLAAATATKSRATRAASAKSGNRRAVRAAALGQRR